MNRQVMNQRAKGSATWEAPLLITGCARSGTTALARLLSTHKGICICNEYSLYWPPVLEESVWHRLEGMRADNPPPEKIAVDGQKFWTEYRTELPNPVSDEDVREWLFQKSQSPLAVYGDKMPYLYLDNISEIVARFPKVKFLLALRDGRAVVASQIRQYRLAIENGKQPMRWMCQKVSEAESIWLRSAQKILEIRDSAPAPYLEVRFEDATRAPSETAKNISEFVGIQYQADEFSTFIESYKPVNANSWRMEIPEIENQLSPEFITALRQLGYS